MKKKKVEKVKKVQKVKEIKKAKKQKKVKAPKKPKELKKSQLSVLKKILTIKRDDLLKVVLRKKSQDIPEAEVGDEIDDAGHTVEKEILFELTNNEKIMLDTIESSLRKVEKNIYGFCEHCGKKISYERLKAMPWARYCFKCQSGSES